MSYLYRLSLGALALALFVTAGAEAKPFKKIVPADEVGLSAERLDALVEHFGGLVEEGRSGGFQLLVARHGKVALYENVGWADVDAREPVSDETLYRIFSMTKPVIGAAMMMLYEEGVYALSDPLSKHIPEFSDLKVLAGSNDDGSLELVEPAREPTVHDLLTHTAGFTYGWFGDTPVDRIYQQKGIADYDDSLQMLIDKLADSPLLYQPGERWHYSVAVDVQGYLIEKWTGQELGEFLNERLFEPLGMDQTMAWAPPGEADKLAVVYTHSEDGSLVVSEDRLAGLHTRAPGGFSGGAQLVSTADDYWRFAQMLLNGGEFDGRRYLSPRTVSMMSSDRLAGGVIGLNSGRGFGFGFGVINDPTRIEHPAGAGEYYWGGALTTVFWIDPEADMVAIMLTQYLPWSGSYYGDLFHRLVSAAIVD